MSSSMASPPSSTSRSEPPHEKTIVGLQGTTPKRREILSAIDSLQTQVVADRSVYIKKRMEVNRQKVADVTNGLFKLSLDRRKLMITNDSIDLLTKRQRDAIEMLNGIDRRNGNNDGNNLREDGYGASSVLLGSSIAVKNAVRPIKLPGVQKLPSYTTWIFLDKNQRMTEDQSAIGRRRIYYDANGEALVCSDSDEDVLEDEETKKEFVDSEDFILRMTIDKVGSSNAVLDSLAQCLSTKPSEVKGRYDVLVEGENVVSRGSNGGECEDTANPYLDKDLDAALDSFDNLFCRRCLVFDCRLHGCSQDLIFPVEKQLPWSCSEEEDAPCSQHCYRLISEISDCENQPSHDNTSTHHSSSPPKTELDGKRGPRKMDKRIADNVLVSTRKKQKNIATSEYDFDSIPSGSLGLRMTNLQSNSNQESEDVVNKDTCKQEAYDVGSWKAIENALFEKGLAIFGQNSCLIARNVLNGMRTCFEVFQHIHCSGNKLFSMTGDCANSIAEGKDDYIETKSSKARRSRILRRRNRVRRLKYTSKSSGYHSLRKLITGKKNQPCRHYDPCGCQPVCGKECPCLVNGTCCEKYCGCSKNCKNRFRGCHCAKSQCRSRQCPCFAADRECDADVCRNCWISCGDGTLGVPSQRGENHECKNMKMLLRQQQRVLLGRSNISGWGAFLKNSVDKHEYLGEYTGELISHYEADKRGKIYDRENYSFLFNLNNQYVLDACRKGDKLKFANHSRDANCYAKVVMVAGDHRVGIFANERIRGGQELLYDYCYEPHTAPDWIKKLEGSVDKKEGDVPSSSRRARKRA